MLTGRFMRGDFFDFKPTHKLLIVGNYKPSLRNVDEAIRRRILLAPFTVQIPEAERDPDLPEKLKAEWPAILCWIVDGCLEWQRYGLVVPTIVRDATAEYFADQDTLAQWAEEWLEPERDAFVLSRVLFASWKQWCEERNLSVGTETAFVDGLKDRGYREAPQDICPWFQGHSAQGQQCTGLADGPCMTGMTGLPLSSVYRRNARARTHRAH